MEPSDSLSFDLDSMFPQSDPTSTHPITTLDETGSSLARHSISDSTATFESYQDSRSGGISSHRSCDKRDTLKQWLRHHSDHPYPTKSEKTSLAQQTGLTVAQVSTWFANARRRHKGRSSFYSNPLSSQSVGSMRESQLPTNEQLSSMSPLERWRNSPPEIEPAPLEAIMSAVAQNESSDPFNGGFDPIASTPGGRRKSVSSAGNGAQSVLESSDASGSGLSSSSGSSAYSFGSNHFGGSFGCFYLDKPPRRQRRRRTRTAAIRPKTSTTTEKRKRPFQCTFCTDTFRTKYDWTRHEKTLHLSLEKFTCAPFGPVYRDSVDGTNRCVFCDEACPSESHTETHRSSTCQQKPLSFRTFYRKDHLVQHLRLMHGVSNIGPAVDAWKSQVENINSRCGFCDDRFVVWSERNDHIAQHFRNGTSMKDWRGCRGLDPPIALAVENAMPPYLIGMESAGMNPFSASRSTNCGGNRSCGAEGTGHAPLANAQPTPFEYLTAQLSEFVKKTSAIGRIVTDEMLQKEARCIVYADDDPWNQTPADNPEWLTLFKEGVGLGSASDPFEAGSSDNPGGDSGLFCLPWSADQWAPLDYNSGCVAPGPLDMSNACMAWSWQSPECLVEFRRHMAASTGQIDGQNEANVECQLSTGHLALDLDGLFSEDR